MSEKLQDFEVQVHHVRERAVLVSLDGDPERAVWLPLSQVELAEERGRTFVTMPEWLATEKGWN